MDETAKSSLKEINEAAWRYVEEAHVCLALWDMGFCGPESAEHGPIMKAVKEKCAEAYRAGALAEIRKASK